MKRGILGRYEQDDAGNSIIDAAAARVEDLYNNFDKSAPYSRRDLDGDLADYLIGCARELGRVPFIIRFTLATAPEAHSLSRIRSSLKSYFLYLIEIENRNRHRMIRRSATLLAMGVAILAVTAWLNQGGTAEQSIFIKVLGEGLLIVAWISLWEALATFLVEWFPHRKNVLLYRRLARTPFVFRTVSREKTGNQRKGDDFSGAISSSGP